MSSVYPRICKQCGKSFMAKSIRRGRGGYCSRKCAAVARENISRARKVAARQDYEDPSTGAVCIPLSGGLVSLVDKRDYQTVKPWCWWHYKKDGAIYARTLIVGKKATMHALIMGDNPGLVVDHKNGNGLDNRRSNLRWATPRQNAANVRGHNSLSGYKGVRKHRSGRWQAEIKVNYRRIYLGSFRTPEEAAHAYDAAAREHFGEFARCNFAC